MRQTSRLLERCKVMRPGELWCTTNFVRHIRQAYEWRLSALGHQQYVLQGLMSRTMIGHLIAYETRERMSNIIAHIPGLVF